MPHDRLANCDYGYQSADGGCAHNYLLGPVKKLIKDLAPGGTSARPWVRKRLRH